MGLQQRRGGVYYTRSKRVNGKVIREYVGSGQFALLAFEMEQADALLEKLRRLKEQELWRQEQEAEDALAQMVGAACQGAEVAFRAFMEAAGYHQHQRGAWRKKRQQQPAAPVTEASTTEHSGG